MENKLSNLVEVEVCYITPDRQFVNVVHLENGGTIQHAIQLSGVLDAVPSIDLDKIKVGIYSKLKTLDTVLKQGDRVEIYRPLQVDPMTARRARAKKKS